MFLREKQWQKSSHLVHYISATPTPNEALFGTAPCHFYSGTAPPLQ